ncbi:MAG: hypothetical protein EZS28_034744 [Streblomastix strix]|uniref:Uncharacterized protein n=1 Tax=Streblomastix strix TaxID=222440 RepID=A0A5J4UI80_9EUKA|nr:MAG: hypothetical protein EZS28_034744 [Streblomastix strix]
MDSSKTRALKNKEWRENMILPKEILQELYFQQGVIVMNQKITLEVKIPEAVMVSDASTKSWGVTLELQTGDILVQHGEWNKEQKRAADQSDSHQVRQLYRSIRFSKTKSRLNSRSGSEEINQAMSTTENTNTDSTYSGNLKQDNRCTKQIKYPWRLLKKERDIHSHVLSMVDNTNTGLVRNRGKQTRGQIRGNRRGRARGRMVERIFQTMEGGDLLDPLTNSEDWKSPDRLGEIQTKVNHDSTLVARSNMVHTLTNRQQQIPNFWRELSESESGEGNDKEEEHVTTKKNRGIPHGPRVDQGRRLLTDFLDNINMTRKTQKIIIE